MKAFLIQTQMNFFKHLSTHAASFSLLLSNHVSRYFPEISERSLKGLENLFAPNLKRKKIFTDKKFLFLSSKQVRFIEFFYYFLYH